MTDLAGKLLAIGMAVFIMLEMYSFAIIADEVESKKMIGNEVEMFIDEVTDSRIITEDMLADLYLAVSGQGFIVDVNVSRAVRVVDPDPKKPGTDATIISFIYSENTKQFNQGDKVKVTVNSIGYTGVHKFVHSTVGILLPNLELSRAGRVR